MSAFLDAANENFSNLMDAFEECKDVETFLKDPDIRIPLFASHFMDPGSSLSMSYDTDGVCIQISELSGIKARMHYLNMPLFTPGHIKPQWHHLKKHIPLVGVPEKALKCLKSMVGICLGSVDGGFFLDLTMVPKDLKKTISDFSSAFWLKDMARSLFNDVRDEFMARLKTLPIQEMSRPTIQKTTLTLIDKMNILEQDQKFIMEVLDLSIKTCVERSDFQIMKTLRKFGYKGAKVINLEDIVEDWTADSVSIHAACNISCNDPDFFMMWSRSGLEELVGSTGRTFTALGMHETANFQTELDNRAMQISPDLRAVCLPDNITFLQLYVDSPHVHANMPFKHPVSGIVTTCGLSHPQFNKSMWTRAKRYLRHMHDLADKLICPFEIRIEQVALFGEGEAIPCKIDPEKFFSEKNLLSLFKEYPMVVPFKQDEYRESVHFVLQKVLTHIVDSLESIMDQSEGQGGFSQSWKAFQYELALEEFFYGHPLSPLDLTLSVSLGTCSTNRNSITNERGFLGLAAHNSASVDEEPPPLHHWTKDSVQVERILRLFPLTDVLKAEPSVIGEALLRILLGDILKKMHCLPLSQLQAERPPGPLKGHVTMEHFCHELATRDAFPGPYVFARARLLVTRAGKDVEECLMSGFTDQGIRFFPDVKFRDLRKGKRMVWNARDFIEVHPENQAPSLSSVAASKVGDICLEVERRGLTYARNLERYREHGMPWLPIAMRRLPRDLGTAKTLNVLTFIRCVGMIMNGDYISYKEMATLMREMQMPQADLQSLKIQSKFQLLKVYTASVWRLDDSLQWRMDPRTKLRPPPGTNQKPQQPEDVPEQPYEDVQAADEHAEPGAATSSPSQFLPAGKRTVWSKEEESLVDTKISMSLELAYRLYVDACRVKLIPARTKKAFSRKRARMMGKE